MWRVVMKNRRVQIVIMSAIGLLVFAAIGPGQVARG